MFSFKGNSENYNGGRLCSSDVWLFKKDEIDKESIVEVLSNGGFNFPPRDQNLIARDIVAHILNNFSSFSTTTVANALVLIQRTYSPPYLISSSVIISFLDNDDALVVEECIKTLAAISVVTP